LSFFTRIYDDIGDYVAPGVVRKPGETGQKKSDEIRRKDYFGRREIVSVELVPNYLYFN
jgi:hypothetical protein